jgi:hypothetical protein
MGKKTKMKQAAAVAPEGKLGWGGFIERAWQRFESIANAAASPIPSSRLKMWLSSFFHPEEMHGELEAKASWFGLVSNLLIFYFFYSLVFFVFMLALSSTLAPQEALSMGLAPNPDISQIALGSLVAGPIVSCASILLVFALVFAAARVLGGNGGYLSQSYPMSLVLCGSNAVLLALICVAFALFLPAFAAKDSPAIGGFLSMAAAIVNLPIMIACLAVFLYSLHAYYLLVKKAHGLSSYRAAGAIALAAACVLAIDFALSRLMRT